MADTICIIQTTLPGEWTESIVGEWSTSLVQDGIAACVQRSRITSVYRWEESLESTEEWRVQLKTSTHNKERLVEAILSSHPYDTPQIISWNAETTSDYASWIEG
ncbi:MAG: divalent-cation tolerance protein CutA [Candidatus Poseidoniia archaeon]|jgi:periplasmic divalent cation tolerance protein